MVQLAFSYGSGVKFMVQDSFLHRRLDTVQALGKCGHRLSSVSVVLMLVLVRS